MPTQIAPVSGVFPADAKLHRLEIRIQAIQLFTISRGSPKRLVPYAWTRPLVFWHACLVTFTFQIQVSHRTQECSSKFLPTTPGIQHGASWRSDSSLSVRRYRSTAACTDGGAGRGRPDLFGPGLRGGVPRRFRGQRSAMARTRSDASSGFRIAPPSPIGSSGRRAVGQRSPISEPGNHRSK
jgi:hypothetical protein